MPFHKQINKCLCQVYPRYSDTAPIGDSTSCLLTARTAFRIPVASCYPDRDYDLTLPFPVFLTFWFSSRDFDFSPTIAAACNVAQPTSFFYLVRETTIFHFVYTSTKVQFYHGNIICNAHGYHNNWLSRVTIMTSEWRRHRSTVG